MPEKNEYMLEIDVVQENMVDSAYYQSLGNETASVSFCVRVNYNYYDGEIIQEVTYHETNVTVLVDLTADFHLDSVGFQRIEADQHNVGTSLSYPIQSYFCNDANVEISQPTLSQGDFIQICCKIPTEENDHLVFVADIWTLGINQIIEGLYLGVVKDTEPSALTEKRCHGGVCNIKTMVPSHFFASETPGPLILSGTAILAFGVQQSRYLRVNMDSALSLQISERHLGEDNPSGVHKTAKEQMQKFSIGVSIKSKFQERLRKFRTSLGVSILILLVCITALVFTGIKLRNLVSQSPEILIPLNAFMSALKNEVSVVVYDDEDGPDNPEMMEVGENDKLIDDGFVDDEFTVPTVFTGDFTTVAASAVSDPNDLDVSKKGVCELDYGDIGFGIDIYEQQFMQLEENAECLDLSPDLDRVEYNTDGFEDEIVGIDDSVPESGEPEIYSIDMCEYNTSMMPAATTSKPKRRKSSRGLGTKKRESHSAIKDYSFD